MTPRQDIEPDRPEATALLTHLSPEAKAELRRIRIQLQDHAPTCLHLRNDGAGVCTCGEAA